MGLGSVNIIDHLSELVSDGNLKNKTIGLVTYQNGINNSLKEFRQKEEMIIGNLPEGPLSIGLFNPSQGTALSLGLAVLADLVRLLEEWVYNVDTLCCTWRMFATFADHLPNHSNFFWVHIAHSEGGLLANLVLTDRSNTTDQKNFYKNHLITLTYGAVAPISNFDAFLPTNTYSSEDITKSTYGEKFHGKGGYVIK